jgi:anti-anti-sigma factor
MASPAQPSNLVNHPWDQQPSPLTTEAGQPPAAPADRASAGTHQPGPASPGLGPVRFTFPLATEERHESILSVAVRGLDPAARIQVGGELDLTTAWELTKQVEQILQDRPREQVVLDLAELRFCSVAGVDALQWIRGGVGHLVLLDPPKIVRKVLTITDTIDGFDIQTTADDRGEPQPRRTRDRLARPRRAR